MAAARLERQSKTAQSNRIQGYVAHFWKSHQRLLLGNWNVLTLTEKELELKEEAKKYHLDIGEVSSTSRVGFGLVDLDGRLKLFYSVADPSKTVQVDVGILTNHQFSVSVFDWIFLGSRAVC